jgi:hypothetical protein
MHRGFDIAGAGRPDASVLVIAVVPPLHHRMMKHDNARQNGPVY